MVVLGVSVVFFILVIFAVVELMAEDEDMRTYLHRGFMDEEGERRCLK